MAEKGSDEFNRLLEMVFEIIVSPVMILEVHSIMERRLREKSLSVEDGKWIENEFLKDYGYFGVVSSVNLVRTDGCRIMPGSFSITLRLCL